MTHYPSLNFDLGDTVDMLRDAVYQFAQAEIAPIAADIDRSNEFFGSIAGDSSDPLSILHSNPRSPCQTLNPTIGFHIIYAYVVIDRVR